MVSTRQKILDKALEMFNERGIEYVGLRELAAQLSMRVGNLTYYFPTKDELVYQLSMELTRTNSELFVADENITVHEFLQMLQRIFENQWRFRCLLLSFVHLMTQNKQVADTYRQVQTSRTTTIQSYIDALIQGGYLKDGEGSTGVFLASVLALINRFWLSEAAISFRQLTPAEQIKHYLQMIGTLMQPYATEKGREEIKQFMQTL
jgi:AcrR family transcriptional regulator